MYKQVPGEELEVQSQLLEVTSESDLLLETGQLAVMLPRYIGIYQEKYHSWSLLS